MATRYVNVYKSSGIGSITPPNIGEFWPSQGGYYIGNKTYGGDNYALILAPKDLFPIILLYDNITSGMANVPKATYIIYDDIRNVSKDADDGESITNNMLNIFISNNLLQYNDVLTKISQIRNDTTLQFNDWYIPALNESIEIIKTFAPATGTYNTYNYDPNVYEYLFDPNIRPNQPIQKHDKSLTITSTLPVSQSSNSAFVSNGHETLINRWTDSYGILLTSCTSTSYTYQSFLQNPTKEPNFFALGHRLFNEPKTTYNYGQCNDEGISQIYRFIRKVKL